MEIGFIDEETKNMFESELAEIYEKAEGSELLVEAHMKKQGWEMTTFQMYESPCDRLESVLLHMKFGAECAGCKSLTLMYTEVDEILWVKKEF